MFTTGNWMVKKGNEQEFIDTWKAFADSSIRIARGAGYAYIFRDAGNPSHFVTFGEWKDIESVQAWMQAPEYDSYMKKFGRLCESHRIMELETVARIGQPEAAVK